METQEYSDSKKEKKKNRKFRKLLADARLKRRVINNIESLDCSSKRRILRNQIQMSPFFLFKDRVFDIFALVAFSIGLAFVAITPLFLLSVIDIGRGYLVPGLIGFDHNFWSYGFSFMVYISVLIISILIMFLPAFLESSYVLRGFYSGRVLQIWVCSFIGLVLLFSYSQLSHVSDMTTSFWEFMIFSISVSLILMFVSIFLISVFGHYVLKFLFSMLKANHPKGVIIDCLLEIIEHLETNDQDIKSTFGTDKEFHERYIITNLEDIADCLERYIFRRKRGGDQMTDFWLHNASMQVSTHIRSLKLDILLPKNEIRDRLKKKVVKTLEIAINDSWGELERMDPKDFKESGFFYHVKRIFKALLIAATPLSLFLVLQETPYAISGRPEDYAKLGTFAWCAVALLTTFDPSWGKKASSMRETLQAIELMRK